MRLLSGLCFAGIYVVAESWLNDRASKTNRGRLLAIYMLVLYIGLGSAQFLLVLANPDTSTPFMLVSVLISMSMVPIVISAQHAPEHSYAVHEITSLLLSCLVRAHCLILNSPGVTGLTGDYRQPAEWLALATAAGLTIQSPHYRTSGNPANADTKSPDQRLLIIAENVIHLGSDDAVPPAIRDRVKAAARAWATHRNECTDARPLRAKSSSEEPPK